MRYFNQKKTKIGGCDICGESRKVSKYSSEHPFISNSRIIKYVCEQCIFHPEQKNTVKKVSFINSNSIEIN